MKQLGDPSSTVLIPISKALYTRASPKPRPGAAARWAHDRVRDIAGSLRACASGAAELSTVSGLCKKVAALAAGREGMGSPLLALAGHAVKVGQCVSSAIVAARAGLSMGALTEAALRVEAWGCALGLVVRAKMKGQWHTDRHDWALASEGTSKGRGPHPWSWCGCRRQGF